MSNKYIKVALSKAIREYLKLQVNIPGEIKDHKIKVLEAPGELNFSVKVVPPYGGFPVYITVTLRETGS